MDLMRFLFFAKEHLDKAALALVDGEKLNTRSRVVVMKRNMDKFSTWRQGGYREGVLRMSFIF